MENGKTVFCALILIGLFCTNASMAQTSSYSSHDNIESVVYQVENMKSEEIRTYNKWKNAGIPEQTCLAAINAARMKYLSDSIKYPIVAKENGIQGRVVVSFIVEKDGSISNVSVVRQVEPSLDMEAIRIVQSMPKWNPGKQKGKVIRTKYNVPVSFRLL